MTLQEKMDQYRQRFGEQFPLYMCMSSTESEIIRKIDSCLARDKPLEYKKDVLY